MERKPVLVGLRNGRVIALSIDISNEERLSFIENGCDSVILMPENSDVPDFKVEYEIKFVDKTTPEGFVLVPKESLKVALYWMDENIDAYHVPNCAFAKLFEHKPILEKALEAQEQGHD